ncbi:MAG TPA: ABC transporter permease [Acidimicrobiales bacterium]|nr:ABC transporter permease [Acidimicrobiales bacterium]
MSWLDAFAMTARQLRRRPGRALLTVLAVALAAALLTALLAVAGTAKTRVLSQLSHGGSLAGITVEPDYPDPADQTLDDPVPGPPNPITGSAIARIDKLSGVLAVLPVVSAPVEILPPLKPPAGSTTGPDTQPISTSVIGASLNHGSTLPVTLIAGRLPLADSIAEVVVGEQYLTSIGLSSARAAEVVGTHVQLVVDVSGASPAPTTRLVTVVVVGVVDEQLTAGEIVAWPRVVDGIYAAESPSGTGSDPAPPIASAVVVAKQLTSVQTVRAAIATIGYSTAAPVGLILSVGRYLHVVELVLSGIGLVALLIAALGIANALLAAVRERRREIGVLKAIGARDSDVMRVWLLEATGLGLAGGVAGTWLGVAMAALIGANANAYLHSQGLAGVALSVPWELPAGSIVGSMTLALVAGSLPARWAARLPAREAVDA